MATAHLQPTAPNWEPLERVIGSAAASDFMWMGSAIQGDALIQFYKHCDNRQYLNVDEYGRTWQYTNGSYTHISKEDAMRRVGIFILHIDQRHCSCSICREVY